MNDLVVVKEFKDKLKQKIQAEFCELIPDVKWDELINSVIEDFLKEDVKKLIREEVYNICKKQVIEELNKPEHVNCYNGPSVAVQQIIKELLPDLISCAYGNIVQQAVSEMKNIFHRGY